MKKKYLLPGLLAVFIVIGITACLVSDDLSIFDNPPEAETQILSGDITIELPPDITSEAVFIRTLLTANYSGIELVSFQWYKNGIAIQNETNATFTPLETGEYTVSVSFIGYHTKTSEPVIVKLPPLSGEITIQFIDNEGNEISDVDKNAVLFGYAVPSGMNFEASYNGNEEVNFQWNRDGTAIQGKTDYLYAPDEPGVYTVTVGCEGYISKTSDTITVIISYFSGDIVIKLPEDIDEDNAYILTTLLTANYDGDEEDYLFQWNRNGAAIIGETEKTFIPTEKGVYTVSLKLLGYQTINSPAVNIKVLEFETELRFTMEDYDFGIGDAGKAVFDSQAPVILSKENPSQTLIISDSSVTNINWYLGVIPLANNSNSLTLNYASFSSGSNILTIEFIKDGKRWSGNFTFTVNK